MISSPDTVLPTSSSLEFFTKDGLPLFRFSHLSKFAELEHAVFTRLGGVSKPPFDSLNVSYDTGDDASDIRENLRRVRELSDSPFLIYARQSHSSKIVSLDKYPSVNPTPHYPLQGVDGFITRLSGLLMMIKVADCQAIFLYDPNRRVAAIVHSGWRGSVQNIIGNAVHQMVAHFDCKPQDVISAIGPSLGPCCAEFRHWHRELPTSFSRFRLSENHFDFWAISRKQLQDAGVLRENIEVAELCTRCHPQIFYSYRGERQTGRFAATIGINV
ncbi:MAG: laccase domain-containing protein [Deltaproteobacteria bacterium]|nr:MAG: laccase domain-containing protein [Deltaproteobacteria bacterium]